LTAFLQPVWYVSLPVVAIPSATSTIIKESDWLTKSLVQTVTIGSGAIETQTLLDSTVLPASSVIVAPSSNTTASASSQSADKSAAQAQRAPLSLLSFSPFLTAVVVGLGAFLWA
jgi:hypothetical protein